MSPAASDPVRGRTSEPSAYQTVVRSASRATAALWIESPLHREQGFFGWLNRLFDTHPPLEERIRVLKEL